MRHLQLTKNIVESLLKNNEIIGIDETINDMSLSKYSCIDDGGCNDIIMNIVVKEDVE